MEPGGAIIGQLVYWGQLVCGGIWVQRRVWRGGCALVLLSLGALEQQLANLLLSGNGPDAPSLRPYSLSCAPLHALSTYPPLSMHSPQCHPPLLHCPSHPFTPPTPLPRFSRAARPAGGVSDRDEGCPQGTGRQGGGTAGGAQQGSRAGGGLEGGARVGSWWGLG